MQSDSAINAIPATTERVRSVQVEGWTVELLPSAPYEVRYTPQQAIIGYAFESQVGTHSFASDKRKDFHAVPNGLAWVPHGCEIYSRSSGGEYLKILCSHEPTARCKQTQRFRDVVIQDAIRPAFALRRILLTEQNIDLLACESLLMAMESSVVNVGRSLDQSVRSRGWVTKDRVRKIDEIIEARLDTPLTVSGLAREFGISAGFLSRELKSALGRTPYQYIVDKRLANARALLCKPEQDLSEIAFACGFSSHSHMSAQFRQQLGTTPAKLRQQLK